MAAIFNGLRGLFMLFLHIKNKDEVGNHNTILNILFGIVLLMVAGSVLMFAPTMIIAVLLLQLAIVRKVDKTMRMSAGHEEREVVTELESQEVESQTRPVFVTTNAAAATRSYAGFRETVMKRAQADLNRRLVRDILIALAYFILPLLWDSTLRGAQHDSPFAAAGRGAAVVLLISVILRWLFMEKQYRPIDAHYKKGFQVSPIKIIGQQAANVLHEGGTNILIGLVIAFNAIVAISDRDFGSLLGLILLASLHLFLLIPLKPKVGANIKLLVLRTFDISENSVFTFGRLINYWKNLGNHFTVVDKSYIRHKYRLISWRTLGILLLLLLCVFAPSSALEYLFPQVFPPGGSLLGSAVTLISPILLVILFIPFQYRQIDHDFIKNREEIQKRIEKMEQRPRGLADATFKGIPTMCHANTWRSTVAEMVKNTDVVLMDLRGFSEQKKGCEYELDFLLDNISVDRLLILISEKDDEEFIRCTIEDLWKKLRTHSPNLKPAKLNGRIEDPQIYLYRSSEQDEVDVQGIFDQLLGTAYLTGRAQGFLTA